MTDLISRLADDIIALINAKPTSPTREEVVGLLQSYLFVDGRGTALYKLPGEHCELPETDETNYYAELMQAYKATAAQPAPLKDTDAELKQAMAEYRAAYERGLAATERWKAHRALWRAAAEAHYKP